MVNIDITKVVGVFDCVEKDGTKQRLVLLDADNNGITLLLEGHPVTLSRGQWGDLLMMLLMKEGRR